MENASEGTHSNKNSHSISSEESAGLSLGLPRYHLKMFRQKRNTHKLLRSNQPYYRNVAKTSLGEPQIIKFENSFHICINIGYIVNAHFLQCCVSSNTSVRVLTDCSLPISTSLSCYHFEQKFHKIGSQQHQVFYYW